MWPATPKSYPPCTPLPSRCIQLLTIHLLDVSAAPCVESSSHSRGGLPMENLVYSLYGLWFWLTRKYRATVYTEVAQTLDSARTSRRFDSLRECRKFVTEALADPPKAA